MSKKEFILDQLAVCRNTDSWFKPLSKAIEGLTKEQASWKPNENSHTIAQIASHLLFYNERWFQRFGGEMTDDYPETNASTFKGLIDSSEGSWRELAADLDQSLEKWQQAIKQTSEEKLHSSIPGFPEEAVWWEVLSNLCTHNAYHIGQIIYIRKMQESWTIAEDWY
ncbi:DinB family protein [Planococcus shenhongbingii]|uniref:DinB family protein n=1 Tax=Planococcus shenhongbingii TaxID=3058398 RepID=A0ABT8NHK1_9BACL|nr:DinB family protein [Planococcus sp. N017]MDN7247368.1 DinB family protein [Planococcus sp. N017]